MITDLPRVIKSAKESLDDIDSITSGLNALAVLLKNTAEQERDVDPGWIAELIDAVAEKIYRETETGRGILLFIEKNA